MNQPVLEIPDLQPLYPETAIHVRTSPQRPLIIEQPKRQPPVPRLIYGGVTLIIWSAWIYLISPLLNLLLWLLGAEFAYQRLYIEGGADGLFKSAGLYFLVIMLTAGGLILWANVNYFRFRGIERRRPREPANSEMLAEAFRVPAQAIRNWQAEPRLVAHFDAHGSLDYMEVNSGEGARKT